MDKADADITAKIEDLSDLELAALVSLVTGQHCIIRTERRFEDALDQELRLVSRRHDMSRTIFI